MSNGLSLNEAVDECFINRSNISHSKRNRTEIDFKRPAEIISNGYIYSPFSAYWYINVRLIEQAK